MENVWTRESWLLLDGFGEWIAAWTSGGSDARDDDDDVPCVRAAEVEADFDVGVREAGQRSEQPERVGLVDGEKSKA